MRTLEQELQKIHDAELGLTITWLWEGGVDLGLVHKSGVAVEGNVEQFADVLPWLEGAIKKYFPKAKCERAAKPRVRETEGRAVRAAALHG
jgi:hypothetical protein